MESCVARKKEDILMTKRFMKTGHLGNANQNDDMSPHNTKTDTFHKEKSNQ